MNNLDLDNKIISECSKLNINFNGLSDKQVKNIMQKTYEEVYDNPKKKDSNVNLVIYNLKLLVIYKRKLKSRYV